MSLTLFGVTYSTVRAHLFPRLDDFSATTSPTSTTVTTKVNIAASRLAAALTKESISPATIGASSTSAAYYICADIVEKMTALSLNIPTDDPETPKSWKTDVDTFLKDLAHDAGVALADPTLSTSASNPNGPTTHLTEYGLEVDDVTDMSDATFPLHAKDEL
jgi:hypothetical protein